MVEFVVLSIAGPLLLFTIIGTVRGMVGLIPYSPGSDVALTLTGIDVTIALSAPTDMMFELGDASFPLQAAATLLLLAGILAMLIGVWAERATSRYQAARTAVQEGWCGKDVLAKVPGPFWRIAGSWCFIALVPFAGNMGVLLGIF